MGRRCIEPSQEYGDAKKLFDLSREADDSKLRDRCLALWMLMTGRSREEVMENFNVKWSTLQQWVRLWNKGGIEQLKVGKPTGRPQKMTDDAKDFVVKTVEFTHPKTGEKITGKWISAKLKKI
jgi:transposase